MISMFSLVDLHLSDECMCSSAFQFSAVPGVHCQMLRELPSTKWNYWPVLSLPCLTMIGSRGISHYQPPALLSANSQPQSDSLHADDRFHHTAMILFSGTNVIGPFCQLEKTKNLAKSIYVPVQCKVALFIQSRVAPRL